MQALLSVTNLSKRVRHQQIIKNLSFTIARGDRVTLFAPSGSGKTTLITILSKLDQHFEGDFHLAARTPATVFQEPCLFPYKTVQENIFFPLQVQQRVLTSELREHYEHWLDICDLREHVAHYPCQISGGMKQKVSLIRSFLLHPDFVMLDEPFKSIDMASKNRIIRHIIERYPDITILLVTHNLDEIPLLTKSLMVFKHSPLQHFIEHEDIRAWNVAELFGLVFQECGE